MADPRFFTNHGPFSLGHLVEIAQAELADGADADLLITDVAPLDLATRRMTVSFIDNPVYLEQFANSKAGACVVSARTQRARARGHGVDHFRTALSRLCPDCHRLLSLKRWWADGIAETAIIDKSAKISEAVMSPLATGSVIAARAEIGAGTIHRRQCFHRPRCGHRCWQ